jgi:hypothetical protein
MSGVDEAIRIDHTEVSRNGVAGSEKWVCWCVVGKPEVKVGSGQLELLPACPSSTKNGEGLLLQLKSAADFVRAVEWTASRPSYG